MERRRRLNESVLYRGINAGLLLCTALFGIWNLSGLGEVERPHLLAAFAALALLAAASLLPGRGRVILLAALSVGIGAAAFMAGPENIAAFVQGGLAWIRGNAGASGGAAGNPTGVVQSGAWAEWALVYEILLAVCLAAVCWPAEWLLERLPVLRPAAASLLLLGLLACMFLGADPGHMCAACAVCYIASAYVEWTQGRWKRAGRGGARAYMLGLMPFLLLYAALMAAMPVSEKPYEWQWAKAVYARVRETVRIYTQNIKWGDAEGFGEALAGFSDAGRLQGGVGENAREVMTVEMRSGTLTHVYLTGKVYDFFDGRQWRQTDPGDGREPFEDAQETLQALLAYNGAYRQDYLSENVLRIRYQDFRTGYLFAPLKTTAVSEDGKEPGMFLQGGDLRWKTPRGYGTVYEVRYYRMNTGKEEFDRFLEAAAEQRKELTGYEREIFESYLGEVALSEGVRAYLEEVTRDAETDIQKLRAMERALASFTYTRSPGELPGQIADAGGFLDYFLLESRQGYCTWFATAFVLLARAEGVPARYVQGFCVPVGERGEVGVTSDMAHAWPEVYIRGVGWIPFEPTPGYTGLRHVSWNMAQGSNRESAWKTDGEDAAYGREEERQDGFGQEETEPAEPEEGREAGRVIGGYVRLLLRFAVPAVLAAGAGALLADYIWSRRRYRRLSCGEKFERKVSENLQVLSWLGLKRGEGETLQELRERGRESPLGFLEDYERVLYGGAEAGEGMLAGAQRDGRILLESLKRERRKSYAFYRVRLYLIGHSRPGKYHWR